LTLKTFKDIAIIPQAYMTSSPSPNPTSNISLGNHPFIWGNIALLAGVPWLLVLSMAGLAVGDPVFPAWFEIFLLGFPAIALVSWVHWQQPISPFSLWFVAKPNERLSEPERQIMTLVKQQRNGWYLTGWIAAVVAIAMSAIFCKIYLAAPLAQVIAPFPASLRLFGIIWAEFFFLLSNILAQAGISALRIKLTAESDLMGLQPFAVEKIKNSFTTIGWRSPQLLKFFEEDAIVENISDTEAIASTTEDVIAEPVEIASAFETAETLLEPKIETIQDEEIVQESKVTDVSPDAQLVEKAEEPEVSESVVEESLIEPIAETEIEQVETFLDFPQVIAEDEIEESATTENEPILEVADVSLDNDFIEESEDLEISAIVAEESVIETITEPKIEQISEEPQIESVLDQELDSEISQEPEQVDSVEAFEESEIETFLDNPDAIAEMEIEESAAVENEAVLEFVNISSDDQLIEETDELENSEIATEETLFEEISEPETAQFFKETQPETIVDQELDQAITHEPEELIPLASTDAVDNKEISIETGLENIDTIPEPIIEEPEIENIVDATDELVTFETDEEPELTFLEVPVTSSETNLEEIEHAEASLESSEPLLDEQFIEHEDSEESESIETAKDSDIEAAENIAITNDDQRRLNFFKKPRKTGGAPKKHGFGKVIKRDHLPVSSLEVFESEPEKLTDSEVEPPVIQDDDISAPNLEPEIVNDLPQETSIELSIEPELEGIDSEAQDFDDELDELIAFNAYVENILKEYLEDNDEDSENIVDNLETVQTNEATPELQIENNVEQSLVDGESSEEESIEQIDPSIVYDPTQEPITQENIESFIENLPAIETQVADESSDEIASNDQEIQDPKYIVQEFLVDKFFAKLEQLNNADKKGSQAKEQIQEIPSEVDTEIDEFADLEALLDGIPLNKNKNTDDLSDRNS